MPRGNPVRERALGRFMGLLVGLVLLPLVMRPIIAADICVFAIAAMALNLIFGYTGMLSFGQATFFGMGAYVGGLLMIHATANLYLALAVGTFAGAITAAVIGYLCIQRVGIYFIMLTFAFNQLFYFLAYKWTTLTGGDDGLPGVPRPPLTLGALQLSLNTSLKYYIFVAVVSLLLFYVMQRIVESPLGMICQSIRENPERAAAVGYNVRRYRWLVFTIAGAFSGFAGVLYAMMYGIVPTEAIYWVTSGDIVFMVLIGGIGNLYGPLLGAVVLRWLSETLSVVWQRWPLLSGTFLIIVVLFLRGGCVEALARLRQWLGTLELRRKEADDGVTPDGEVDEELWRLDRRGQR
jgi:branched-chain amino acid transport system permease protein